MCWTPCALCFARKVPVKIDLIDMEAWTLTRAAFSGTEITVKTVGLNHVLAYSGH